MGQRNQDLQLGNLESRNCPEPAWSIFSLGPSKSLRIGKLFTNPGSKLQGRVLTDSPIKLHFKVESGETSRQVGILYPSDRASCNRIRIIQGHAPSQPPRSLSRHHARGNHKTSSVRLQIRRGGVKDAGIYETRVVPINPYTVEAR